MKAPSLLLTTLLLAVAAGLVLSGAGFGRPAAAAAPEPWTIRLFDATYAIQADGSVEVTEKILVDFQGLDIGGIHRLLPLEMEPPPESDSGERRAVEIEVESVTDAGDPVPFSSERRGANLVLGIDPDCQCRAQIEYRIVYRVRGALTALDDHDTFRWNVTGAWPVPILRVDARVVAPVIEEASCARRDGAEPACRLQRDSAGEAWFIGEGIEHGDSLLIGVDLPPDAVEVPPPLLVSGDESWLDSLSGSVVAVGAAVLLLISAGLWFASGRQRDTGS